MLIYSSLCSSSLPLTDLDTAAAAAAGDDNDDYVTL
jgi:hypothetical protein